MSTTSIFARDAVRVGTRAGVENGDGSLFKGTDEELKAALAAFVGAAFLPPPKTF